MKAVATNIESAVYATKITIGNIFRIYINALLNIAKCV